MELEIDSAVRLAAFSFLEEMTQLHGDVLSWSQLTREFIFQGERVLRAYHSHCAVCRLGHRELLDAAHILPDRHPGGHPVVPNGLALCKLHHAAFDRHILGIRPDLLIEIRRDILEEHDGPMLRHGLQELEGTSLANLPRSASQRPGREFLEHRYEIFRSAS